MQKLLFAACGSSELPCQQWYNEIARKGNTIFPAQIQMKAPRRKYLAGDVHSCMTHKTLLKKCYNPCGKTRQRGTCAIRGSNTLLLNSLCRVPKSFLFYLSYSQVSSRAAPSGIHKKREREREREREKGGGGRMYNVRTDSNSSTEPKEPVCFATLLL